MDLDKLVPIAAQSVVAKQASAQQAEQQVVAAQQDLAAARQAVTSSQDRLSALAVAAYVRPDEQTADVLVNGDTTEQGRRTVLLEVAITDEQDRLAQAKAAVTAGQQLVEQARQAQVAAASAVDAAQLVVRQLTDQAASLRRVASTAASSNEPWQLTIEGESEFTAPELAAWFATQDAVPEAQVSIAQLAQYYIDEGHDQGIRGDVAFAQSVVETGGFTNPDTVTRNNYAGIGHCDSCQSGFSFPTAQLGVRAQMQLLGSYAEVFPTYAHPLVDPRLKGPAGCCATWNRLTKVWATDPNYGPVILGVYQRMLEWLILERGGTLPPGV